MINGLITHDQSQRWTLHTSHAHAFLRKSRKTGGIIDSHYIIRNCTGIGASTHSTQFFIIIDQIMKVFLIFAGVLSLIYTRLTGFHFVRNPEFRQSETVLIIGSPAWMIWSHLHQCHNLFHTVLLFPSGTSFQFSKQIGRSSFSIFIFPIILIRSRRRRCPYARDNDILLTYDAADFLTAAVNRSRNRSTQLRLFRNDQERINSSFVLNKYIELYQNSLKISNIFQIRVTGNETITCT